MKFSEELMNAFVQARLHRNPQKLNDICEKLPKKFQSKFANWVSQYAPIWLNKESRIKIRKGKTIDELPPLDGSSIQISLAPGSLGNQLNEMLKTIHKSNFIARDDKVAVFAFLILCSELGLTGEEISDNKQPNRWFDDLERDANGHSVRALPGGATGLKK